MVVSHKVQLRFGEKSVDVELAGATEDLDLSRLRVWAEASLGLPAKSFDLHDQRGIIDTDGALRRAIGTADRSGLPYTLEVHEHPEWAKMRQLEDQIQALSSVGPAMIAAMQELELRMKREVESAVAEVKDELRQTDVKVESLLEPMLEGMPPVPVVAAVGNSIKELEEQFTVAVREAVKDLEEHFRELGQRVDAAAASEGRIRQELKVAFDCALLARDEVTTVQTEARRDAPLRKLQVANHELKNANFEADIRWNSPASPSSKLSGAFSYSNKSPKGAKNLEKNMGAMGLSPFAKKNLPRRLDRMPDPTIFSSMPDLVGRGSLLPHLPPAH